MSCILMCLSVNFVVIMMNCVVFFFFFKQKTAYEMRISDWSSDVCAGDEGGDDRFPVLCDLHGSGLLECVGDPVEGGLRAGLGGGLDLGGVQAAGLGELSERCGEGADLGEELHDALGGRSDEQQSELQSLMRSSYAVFCLKKK